MTYNCIYIRHFVHNDQLFKTIANFKVEIINLRKTRVLNESVFKQLQELPWILIIFIQIISSQVIFIQIIFIQIIFTTVLGPVLT